MLWQTWRELFVVEDGEIFALVDEDSDLVVRRQLDDLLLRQIEQNYHGILPLVLSSRNDYLFTNNVNVLDTSVVESELFLKVLFHPIFGERYNFSHFGKNFAVLNQTSW